MPEWLLITLIIVGAFVVSFFAAQLKSIAATIVGGTLRHVVGDKRAAKVSDLISPEDHGEELFAWANSHGYQFEDRDDSWADKPWGPPFGVGETRGATGILTGTVANRPVVCFSLFYESSVVLQGNVSSSTDRYSVYSTTVPGGLPSMQVTRANVADRLGHLFGHHDVLVGDEAFDHTFEVRADDVPAVTSVLSPSVRAIVAADAGPGFRLVGDQLVVITKGRLAVEGLEARIRFLTTLGAALPTSAG